MSSALEIPTGVKKRSSSRFLFFLSGNHYLLDIEHSSLSSVTDLQIKTKTVDQTQAFILALSQNTGKMLIKYKKMFVGFFFNPHPGTL